MEKSSEQGEDAPCWYYLADCGSWHRFEDDTDNPPTSETIESHFKTNSNDFFDISDKRRIDFSVMLLTDLQTGQQSRIYRSVYFDTRCCCYSSIPVYWEMVDPKLPYQLIRLSDHNPEFQTVASSLKDGMFNRSIVSISRIQNINLWEMFCRKKKQLLGIQGVNAVLERKLFHGTKASNVHNICTYNFDLRFSGANGHDYGRGIYFARHAMYADKFSVWSAEPLPLQGGAAQREQDKPTRILFLARVMIGKSRLGRQFFQSPDHDSSANSYNSCVDNVSHPRIFVVFEPNQIYPEYLIQYR